MVSPLFPDRFSWPDLLKSYLRQLERFSIQCRKTKTKVITDKRKQHNGPIRTRSK